MLWIYKKQFEAIGSEATLGVLEASESVVEAKNVFGASRVCAYAAGAKAMPVFKLNPAMSIAMARRYFMGVERGNDRDSQHFDIHADATVLPVE